MSSQHHITYAFATTALGRLLVGSTPSGICCALFGESDGELETALERELPKAELTRDDGALRSSCEELATWIDVPSATLPATLDLIGTPFQLRVWSALLEIAPGHTVTYSELAGSLGMPKGARAVASACAANHVAVLVPCHRVVAAGGGLGGYKWGLDRKRLLLDRESSH